MLFRNIYTRLANAYYQISKTNNSLINSRKVIEDNNDMKVKLEAKMEVLGYKLLDIKLRGRKRWIN